MAAKRAPVGGNHRLPDPMFDEEEYRQQEEPHSYACYRPFMLIPMQQLLSPAVLANLLPATRSLVLGKEFFPSLTAPAFMDGMRWTFYGAAGMSLVAVMVSFLRGKTFIHETGIYVCCGFEFEE